MDNETLKSRLTHFIRYKGLKINEFERLCGLTTGYVAAMRKGLGPERLKKVLDTFPDLSRDWLVYGEGEMLKSSTNTINAVEQNNIHGDNLSSIGSHVESVLLEEIQAHRRQVDILIGIIKDMQKGKDQVFAPTDNPPAR